MDLSNLGLAELRALEVQLKVEIKRRENQDMAQAREKIMAIAHSVGIPLKDLIAASGRAASTGAGRGGAGELLAGRRRRAGGLAPAAGQPAAAAGCCCGG